MGPGDLEVVSQTTREGSFHFLYNPRGLGITEGFFKRTRDSQQKPPSGRSYFLRTYLYLRLGGRALAKRQKPSRVLATCHEGDPGNAWKKWRWHDLHAAFITQVALTGGPIAAQALAGHSDFRTTEVYIAVADDVLRAGAVTAANRPALALLKGGKAP